MANTSTARDADERKRADRERKRKARKDLRAKGLRPYEIWVTATEWPQVKRYIKNLAKSRPAAGRE
ncbi:MAG: antitoxin MazE-like protein [Steroidobacteraceae bacterium]|jgi:hypothetical protein